MNRTYFIILFGCLCVAGLGLIAYGILAGRRRKGGSEGSDKLAIGFVDSPEQPFEILDLNMGHEGLMHREKERFDPDRHRPERIISVKKPVEKALSAGDETKPTKIEVS
jgi:hypothetical protein